MRGNLILPIEYGARAIVAARVASLFVTVIGLIILAGWFLDIPGLTYLYLPGPNVKTNAGLSLTTAALANLLLISSSEGSTWRRVGRGLAVVPLTLGALTLSEHLGGWDLGIDQFLATEPAGAYGTVSPNRMGPPASTTFLLLGLSLVFYESQSASRRRFAQIVNFAACVIPILPLMGYAYGFSQLYAIARYTGIALTSAITLLVLGVAVMAGRPGQGLGSLLCRSDEVGTLCRRLLPAGILLPFVMGWMLSALLKAGVMDGHYAISAMGLVLIAGFTALIWRTGRTLAASLDARVAAERALSESARSLREADRQKNDFMATLSHELRNPLAPIRFALELIDAPAPASERARQTIRRQVQHLTRLVDDLLDLTRITRNKLQLQVRRSELRVLVHDAVDAVSGEIARGGQRLEIQLPEETVWLHVDPDRVVQMLTNLLNNAARYTDAGGRITIAAVVEGHEALIRVRDTGVGISPADLDRVFESFVQVGTSRHGGLGIGLALVKGLAELHGGRVEASSEGPGRGAEFCLRLPTAEAPALEQTPASAPRSTLRHRILVVDDNRDAADLLRDVLVSNGHDVLVAYDAKDVLRDVAAFEPTVGLLDLGMPGMNGVELASELRRHPELSGMFLVAITGWGQEEDRRRALAAGFDAHLTKPAAPDQILALIAERFAADDREARGATT